MSLGPSAVIALGVIISLVFDRRTGLSCGGFVGPGTVALSLGDPQRLLWGFLITGIVTLFLRLGVRYRGWYGRYRVGMAMILALGLRFVLARFLPEGLWLGWVVPGLIAADVERQGVAWTLPSVVVASLVTSFAALTIETAAGWMGAL